MRRLTPIALSFMIAVAPAFAVRFPDVPPEHPYEEPIEALAEAGVVKGTPQGTFEPNRTVNRAEMLTMLYRATGRAPDAPREPCFPDVSPASWYAAVVCDAEERHFVAGYADGWFRPEREVSRVESLKMIMEVLGMHVPELSVEGRTIVKFVDVSQSAWYTKYLVAAFESGMLPIAGQDGPRFYPDAPLLRGEAAAYIHAALGVRGWMPQQEEEEEAEEQSTAEAQSSASTASAIESVTFPFETSGAFDGKKSRGWKFGLKEPTTASVQTAAPGGLSCRLFKLEDSGLTIEYYLGFEEDDDCTMLVALGPGTYQLELFPKTAGATFAAEGSTATGDGNDGFREAVTLSLGKLKTGVLQVDDTFDWYRFTVSEPKRLTVKATSDQHLRCIVNALGDVDLFGFVGPACGTTYDYQPGTYVVGVGHPHQNRKEKRYSVILDQ